jgi:hypothetical protein
MISTATVVFENGQEVEVTLLSANLQVEVPGDTDYGLLDKLSTLRLPSAEYYVQRNTDARGNLVRLRLVGQTGAGYTKPEPEPKP